MTSIVHIRCDWCYSTIHPETNCCSISSKFEPNSHMDSTLAITVSADYHQSCLNGMAYALLITNLMSLFPAPIDDAQNWDVIGIHVHHFNYPETAASPE